MIACLISLESKGLSRVFSNTTVQRHQFFGSQLTTYITSISRHNIPSFTSDLSEIFFFPHFCHVEVSLIRVCKPCLSKNVLISPTFWKTNSLSETDSYFSPELYSTLLSVFVATEFLPSLCCSFLDILFFLISMIAIKTCCLFFLCSAIMPHSMWVWAALYSSWFIILFKSEGSRHLLILRKFLVIIARQNVLPMFSSRSFILSCLIVKSLSHFQSIFVPAVRVCSNFIDWLGCPTFPAPHAWDCLFSTLYSFLLCLRLIDRRCVGVLPWDVCSIPLIHMVIIILNGICLHCRRPQFDSWVRKIPWRRERLPTPIFWTGEFHGLQSGGVAKSQTWLSDFHFPLILFFLSGSLLTYVSLFHSTHHVS